MGGVRGVVLRVLARHSQAGSQTTLAGPVAVGVEHQLPTDDDLGAQRAAQPFSLGTLDLEDVRERVGRHVGRHDPGVAEAGGPLGSGAVSARAHPDRWSVRLDRRKADALAVQAEVLTGVGDGLSRP